ncbi:MAG: SDR family oxidoreductase [Alphaproteobacteria bacterium]|nr:SDR family oxidoreductase [Alphaproteobacteria bacterium]
MELNHTFSGAHALITGATGGIGQAIARVFHAHGAHVHLSGRRTDVLQQLKDELGQRCDIWPMDLSDRDSIHSAIDKIQHEKIPLNILINNGGTNKNSLALRIKDGDWDEVSQTNLSAPFLLCRSLFPLLKESALADGGYARIINISSVVAFAGNVGQAHYVAAKSGLTGLTKALALEWASRSITVNAIAPGFIATPMTEDLDLQAWVRKIPTKRVGTPEEIAFAALFLADARASYITGQTIHVNGGLCMV